MSRETVTEDEKKFFYSGRPLPLLYVEYLNYLRSVRKVATGTVQNRKIDSLRFLLKFSKHATPGSIGKLKPVDIQEYTIETARQMKSRHRRRSLIIVLRDFFRFVHFAGYTKSDLSVSVPMIVTHRHSSVPKGLPWPVVEQLLKVPNRHTFCGKRDYAIILMLARYGVRAIQLRDLRLTDIDLKKKTVHFKGCKGGKDVLAPLLPDVRAALFAYFKGGRMKAPKEYKQVFLTSGSGGSIVTGQRPLEQSTWNIVANAFKKLNIETAPNQKRGPHAIRHAYATRLLEKNEPIKSIADLLGHKSLETTFIYTKSSVEQLRPLTRQWPEGEK
jgi:site-specific recombinase XerD